MNENDTKGSRAKNNIVHKVGKRALMDDGFYCPIDTEGEDATTLPIIGDLKEITGTFGEPFYLSLLDRNIIYHLHESLSVESDKRKKEAESIGKDPRFRNQLFPVEVDIFEMTKSIFSGNRAEKKNVIRVITALFRLSWMKKTFEIMGDFGPEEQQCPLFYFGNSRGIREYFDPKKQGRTRRITVEINFTYLTLKDLYQDGKFFLMPSTPYKIINENQSNTPLFHDLLTKLGGWRKIAINNVKKKELEDPEEIRKELTYTLRLSNIIKSINIPHSYAYLRDSGRNKKGAIRWDRVEKDLKKAGKALKELGIIQAFKYEKINPKEMILDFVIENREIRE